MKRNTWSTSLLLGGVWFLAASAAVLQIGCATSAEGRIETTPHYGVLVMAHGGTEIWNEAVTEATRTVEKEYPVEIAFGMASAESLQESTGKLEERGVETIGVVRLFVSGESWLERTRQILGVSPGAPPRHEAPPSHDGGHHDFAATFWQIETHAEFALSREGLSHAGEMSQVLLERARGLSVDMETESVLILAHGPANDAENERWIAALDELADPLRLELPFRDVEVQTLREDWAEKREVAQERIRTFVQTASEDGGRCLVIPFRVFGFGPYAEVLEGLDYASDGLGLLPHDAVGAWILRQAESLSSGPFEPTLAPTNRPRSTVEVTGH